jgi:flagellar M-ring protein FliF
MALFNRDGARTVDQLRSALATIQKYLGGMTPSQKLLIGSLAVIMLMTLFLVSQYAGKQNMVAVWPGASSEDHQRALTFLQNANFPVVDRGGQPYVAAERRLDATAALTQGGQSATNSAVVFENILKSQNWMNSREQNRQIYKVMLDNELSNIVSKFDSLRAARVLVDAPESIGIGQAARAATASVTLFAAPGRSLDQSTVDAAARFVAGSVSGLDLERVTVTDGAGRPRRVTLDDDLAPGNYREYAAAVEKQFRRKIENLVVHIQPPAVVEVTAGVDVTRVRAQVNKTLPIGEGSLSMVRRETSSSTTEAAPSAGGEPGVRSNQSADINAAQGRASRSEQKEEETEFTTAFGTRTETIDDPRGHPTWLAATVAIPRGYIAGLLVRERGGDASAAPPSEVEIENRFAIERDRLLRGFRPHLQTRGPDGEVVEGAVEITMMSGDPYPVLAPGGFSRTASFLSGGDAGGGALGTILLVGSGMIDKLVLGVLALVALGMMALMVRKVGRKPMLATAEELAGVPPALEMTSDLVGEADESETAIPGILVGEDEIKAAKLREQVSDLIRKDPEVAGKMFNRWIAVEN